MRSRRAITGAASLAPLSLAPLSLAALSLCAAGAIALYGAGPASALPAAGSAQVSGTVLQTALLPASDFGAGFTSVVSGAPNSGSRVLPPSAGLNPAILDCGAFESEVYLEAFGQTAGALASYTNPAWQAGKDRKSVV